MNESAHATTAGRWRRVALIVTAAFGVKLVVLLQLWDHPLLQPHGELDTAYYVALAQRIATEGVLASTGAFVVSPLYVYFLAAVFAAGGSLLAAQAIQIGLGAAAVGLQFATARHWFGERAALAAAALSILTGFFTFSEVLILQSALDPFLVSCALYAITRTMSGTGPSAFATAGASLGLLALNRPNALVFAVAAAGGVFVSQGWRIRFNRASVLLAALLAVLAANAARNYAVSGHALVIASHGGLNLYIGNHDRADGTYTPVPGITPSIAGQVNDSTRVAESNAGRTLSPSEVSNYFAGRALDWVIEHPADALWLWIRKIGILVNRVDVPLNYSYAFYAGEPLSVLGVLGVGPWLVLPLGLVGLLWPSLRASRRGYWVWAMFVPVYGAAVVLFFVSDRYRMPMLVPLCTTAGAALIRLLDLLRSRQFIAFVRPAGAVALVALIVFADLGLDDGVGGEQTRKAVLFVERGSFDEAREYVEQVSNGHRHPGVLRFRVGQALLDAGRHSEAARLLAEALAIDGPQPAIRLALGEALVGAGRGAEAVGHLEAAYDGGLDGDVAGPLLMRALVLAGRAGDAVKRMSLMPVSVAGGSAEVALDFGTLALERGATVEALRWLQLAVEHAPDRAEAHEKLGLAIFLQGDARSAVAHLERAIRLEPGRASAHLNLAVVFAELGRFAEARRHAAEARRLDPAEPRAAELLKALPE
jgi:Flp pilus assembly protein TadD